MSRILYLNIHNPDYPRNRQIRSFLARQGHDVVMVPRRDLTSFVLQSIDLYLRARSVDGPFEYVILSELSIQYAAVAKAIARRHRASLIVDAFVGMYETNIGDWRRQSAKSWRAVAYRSLDKFALAAAQLVLIDTDFRAAALASDTHGWPLSIPVGAPEWAVPRPGTSNDGCLRVLYYGNYIRLHGLDFVLAAIAMLAESDRIAFTFLGDGEDRRHIEAEVAALGIEDRVTFAEPVPEKELAEVIANHHVVLGVFGESTKAQGVIANKVWQGLACGRLVVTRESPALKELEMIARDQLLTVSTTSPANLAKVLRTVSKNQGTVYPDITAQLTRYTQSKLNLFDRWLRQNP